MSEDILDSNENTGNGERPVFLTVICILSFIGAGLGILAYITAIGAMGVVSAAGADLAEGFEGMEGVTTTYSGPSVGMTWAYVIVGFIATIVSLLGVIKMWKLQKEGFVAAGEQLGVKVEGFDIGNSPLSYLDSKVKGCSVALTTTNGVKALKQAESAYQIIIGAFLNLSAVSEYITSQERDVLVVAAGWRGHFNLEDSLFTGAVVEKAIDSGEFEFVSDSAWAALNLYKNTKNNLDKALKSANHYQRLLKFDCQKDIDFCLTIDTYTCLPILKNGELVLNEPSLVK
mgnify:CR=1 FL=1